jgi:hypothetical protein
VFESTRQLAFFDYFRVPYDAGVARGGTSDGWARLGRRGDERSLVWLDADRPAGGRLAPARHELGGRVLFARVARDDDVAPALRALGGRWSRVAPILDERRSWVASVWRRGDGSVLLPFDPDEAMRSLWREEYAATGPNAGVRRRVRSAYYLARPLIPRRGQILLRRGYRHVQERASFPAWPIETALHDLYDLLFALVAELAEAPVPYLAPWPAPYAWAMVLSHDVETAAGYEQVRRLRAVELEHGFRSSWNFVPRRYEVQDADVDELWRLGFEVGLHGLFHDGRDLESRDRVEERLPAMREHAERWRAVGFRSPSTQRAWELMPLLGFDYDSSYPDTDPFEPQPGGCCSLLPYENGSLVELPITLPQDHTAFVILGERGEGLWLRKAWKIRRLGGMALLLTHPDYMVEGDRLQAYGNFLAAHGDDATLWRALPREVSAWWRRRAASSLEPDSEGGWRVVGPAAGDAAVAFAGGH